MAEGETREERESRASSVERERANEERQARSVRVEESVVSICVHNLLDSPSILSFNSSILSLHSSINGDVNLPKSLRDDCSVKDEGIDEIYCDGTAR